MIVQLEKYYSNFDDIVQPISEESGMVKFRHVNGGDKIHSLSSGLFVTHFTPGARIKHVCGIVFSTDKSIVVLASKRQEDQRRSKLHGISGIVISGETPEEAMERIFNFSTGAIIVTWRRFHVMTMESIETIYMVAFINKVAMANVRTVDEDAISIEEVSLLIGPNAKKRINNNLTWLIPMALDPMHKMSKSEYL